MQQIYENRVDEYDKDIVYATNHEIGFDYLRDNLKSSFDSLFFNSSSNMLSMFFMLYTYDFKYSLIVFFKL